MAVHAGLCPHQTTVCMTVYKRLLFFLLCNFVTAAALFYLAELVEEYTVLTAKVIKGMLVVSSWSAFAYFVCVKYLSWAAFRCLLNASLLFICKTRTVLDADGATPYRSCYAIMINSYHRKAL